MLAWNAYGAFGTLALVAGWSFGAFVYFTAPHRLQNRVLALLLFAEGLSIGTGEGAMYLMADASDAYAAQQLTVWAGIAAPFLYLLLLSTLDTPITRPLRARPLRALLIAAAAVLPFSVVAWPALFVVGVEPHALTRWTSIVGSMFGPVILFWTAVSAYGLVAAVWAWRRAPGGSAARDQARAFALAFGVRDILLILLALNNMFGILRWLPGSEPRYLWPLVTILFVVVAGYGVARTQLFDIDLRLKRGLRASTLTATFVAVFFIVSESAQQFLSAQIGSYLGIAAAGLLLFALAPLQRLAERFADAAMPTTTGSAEYVQSRKLAIMRAAIEGAYDDGTVSEREREVVRRLQLELGVANDEVARIEAEVQAARPAA